MNVLYVLSYVVLCCLVGYFFNESFTNLVHRLEKKKEFMSPIVSVISLTALLSGLAIITFSIGHFLISNVLRFFGTGLPL